MFTSKGVDFYSYMVSRVFGDTLKNVDDVDCPRFFVFILTNI